MFKKCISLLLVCLVITNVFVIMPINTKAASYKDEFIDAVLDSEGDLWDAVGAVGYAYLKLIDLNFDGKLEFIKQYSDDGGFSLGSTSPIDVFYYENGKLLKTNTTVGINNELTGYYNEVTNKYMLIQPFKAFNGYDNNYTLYNQILKFNGKEMRRLIYSSMVKKDNPSDNVYYDGPNGYLGTEKSNIITKEEYDCLNNEIIKNCVNINMQYPKIKCLDWINYSSSQKRQALEEAYDSFTYDTAKMEHTLGLQWGRDNFSFTNSADSLPVFKDKNGEYQYDMELSLVENIAFSDGDIKSMKKSLQNFGGACFGMSCITYKNAIKDLDLNSIQKGKTTLYGLSGPKTLSGKNLKNMIGIYQASVSTSKYQVARDKFINLPTKEKLTILYNKLIDIEETQKPIMLDYAWIDDEEAFSKDSDKGVGAHAVVAYSIENNQAPYILNGESYEYKVWVIDPNLSLNTKIDLATASSRCMYLKADLSGFCIPRSGTTSDTQEDFMLTSVATEREMKKNGDANLQFITDDYDLLPPTTSDFNAKRVESDVQVAKINGKLVSGYNIADDSISSIAYNPCGSGATISIVIKENDNPTITTVCDNQSISMVTGDQSFFLTANKDSSINMTNKEVSFKNASGEYELELVSELYDVNYDDIVVRGDGKQEITLSITDEGLNIKGDDLSGTTISTETDSVTINSSENEILIKEDNNELTIASDSKILGDTDGDSEITIMDATAIQLHIAKIKTLTSSQTENAETDGDGAITIMDATEIQLYIAKLIPFMKGDSEKVKDTTDPTAVIKSTNNVSDSQKVTLSFSDNIQIEGYYWGTNKTYTNNTYTHTSNSSTTKTITEDGTYYLVAKDTSGNISEPQSITFCRTTLNAKDGTVELSRILSVSGQTISLPTPSKSGATFIGWSTISNNNHGVKVIKPTSNTGYYAVWMEPSTVMLGDYTLDGIVDFDDILQYNKIRNGKIDIPGDFGDFMFRSDLHRDGIFDFNDIEAINKIRLGKVESADVINLTFEKITVAELCKTSYSYGQSLNTDGLTINAYFNDYSYTIGDKIYVSGYNPYIRGKQELTVHYYQFTTKLTVTVS